MRLQTTAEGERSINSFVSLGETQPDEVVSTFSLNLNTVKCS